MSDKIPGNAIQGMDELKTEDWDLECLSGRPHKLAARFGRGMTEIPLRHDEYAGAVLVDGSVVQMQSNCRTQNMLYQGRCSSDGKNLSVKLQYSVSSGKQLQILVSLQNLQTRKVEFSSIQLRLGFDTFLLKYPDYLGQLFPTLLRCEKTHLWGYFSMPDGHILTLFTDQPVASYTLEYEKDAQGIFTASIDLMQSGRLPERHPQNLNYLDSLETKTWCIHFVPVPGLFDIRSIKPMIANCSGLILASADKYTVGEEEHSRMTFFSGAPLKENGVHIVSPNHDRWFLPVAASGKNQYCALFPPKRLPGVYVITAENEKGYSAEMRITVRKPWSWYMQAAAQAVLDAPQKATSHAESWYGFYTAYLARKYFPNSARDSAVDQMLAEVYPLIYDAKTGGPLTQRDRIQNHSSMLGICVDIFESTGSKAALYQAETLADLVLGTQKPNGGFYKGSTDYTSVIYPAKSIMELITAEQNLISEGSLSSEERLYFAGKKKIHESAVERAMDHLSGLDGNFSTEGATASCYEDGANSCSATQLSQYALMLPKDAPKREKYKNAAKTILDRHTSHEQAIIPDSRMVGGTLRYWEAQYDVEMGGTAQVPRGQMMDSPHGWSAWNIYALFNLYQLTGQTDYLQRGMNAIGSCTQLMNFDGELRWAFIPDPQRNVKVFMKDEEHSSGNRIIGKHVEQTIGEQYLPMISSWWRAPAGKWVPGYTKMGGPELQGAACDNDVHEIFKALEETVLTKAYIAELENGNFLIYNAVLTENSEEIVIVPSEQTISQVSVLLRKERKVIVLFKNRICRQRIGPNTLAWIENTQTEENEGEKS